MGYPTFNQEILAMNMECQNKFRALCVPIMDLNPQVVSTAQEVAQDTQKKGMTSISII